MPRLHAFAIALGFTMLFGCRPTSSPTIGEPELPPAFDDVTAGSGIAFTYVNGEEANHYSILETLGGGVGLIDFDGDGRLDVFVAGGGSFGGGDKKQIRGAVNRLYRNLGSFKFEDVTTQAGLERPLFYSHGVAVADFDCDGWPDLLLTGYDGLALFRNIAATNGRRKFVDVSREMGLPVNPGWCTSAVWADLNGDGFPELYVCRYVNWSFANHPPCQGDGDVARDVCTPRKFEALPHFLFLNERGRSLRDVSRQAGLRFPPRDDRDYGKGLGVLAFDANSDGKPDLYVANDTTDNLLYLNESGSELKLREAGLKLGVARDGGGTPNGSMGVDAADYDGAGRPSLWVTNYEGELHALYRATETDGRRYFQFSSQSAGTAAVGQLHVGFGTAFFDYDSDGWEDIVVSNGHVLRRPTRTSTAQKPILFRNLGDGRFAVATPRGGAYFSGEHKGRGLAIGDLDNDGRPDIVVSHANEPVAVLQNVNRLDSHWIGMELQCKNRGDIVGARVTLESAGRRLTRFAKGGGSYLSASDRRILFGLGSNTQIDRLTVYWPHGEPRVEEIKNVPIDKYFRVEQGHSERVR